MEERDTIDGRYWNKTDVCFRRDKNFFHIQFRCVVFRLKTTRKGQKLFLKYVLSSLYCVACASRFLSQTTNTTISRLLNSIELKTEIWECGIAVGKVDDCKQKVSIYSLLKLCCCMKRLHLIFMSISHFKFAFGNSLLANNGRAFNEGNSIIFHLRHVSCWELKGGKVLRWNSNNVKNFLSLNARKILQRETREATRSLKRFVCLHIHARQFTWGNVSPYRTFHNELLSI